MTDAVALCTCTEQIDNLIRQQCNDEAITLCKHVLRYYPKHVVTYRQMAEASLEKGDLNGALELFRRVLGADPENILAYAGLAIVFEQQHLIAEAAWQLERAYELNPADFEIRKELLRLYADVEGTPRARLKLTPGGLARLYLQQGLLSQAIQELSALAPNSDGRYDVRVALMQALWQAGRPREAAEGAQSLLEALPFCLKANLILGTVWAESGLEESGTYLQRAQALDPTNQIAQETLGAHSPLSPANPLLPKYVEGAPEFSTAPAPAVTAPAEPDWLGTLKPPDQPAVETSAPVSTGEEWLSEKPASPLQLTSGAPPATEAAPEAAAEAAPEEPLPADRAIETEPAPEAPAPQAPSEFVPAETAEPASTVSETEVQPSEPAQPPTAAGEIPEWLRGEPTTLPAPAEHVERPPVEMTRPAWLANLIQAQEEALESAASEDQPGAAEPTEAPDENATPSWLGPAAMATEENRVTEESPETPQWLRQIVAASAEEPPPAAEAAPAETAAETTLAESTPAPAALIEAVPAEPVKPAPSVAAPAPVEPATSEPEDLPDWLKKLRAEFEADQASLHIEQPAVSKAPPPVKAPPPPVVSPHVEVPPPAEVGPPAEVAAPAVTPAPVEVPSSVALPPKVAEPASAPLAEPIVEPKAAEPAVAPPAPAPQEPAWLVQMRAELGGEEPVQPPQAERAASQAQAAPAPEPPPAIAAPPPSEPTAPARQEPAAPLPAAPAPRPAAPTEAVPPQTPASPAAEQPSDTQSILVRREAVALIRLDQARSYRDKKRLGEALDEYNYIVQQAPQFVADVIHDLEEIIGEPSAPLQAHRILGDAYTRANRLPEALERYRFVLDHVS